MKNMKSSLGVIELSSIARGVVVSDALLKKAHVSLIRSMAVSCGKHIIMFVGDIAEVEESFHSGVHHGGADVIDSVMIPMVDKQIAAFLPDGKSISRRNTEALLVIETKTVCSTLLGVDAAVKASDVVVIEMQFAVGIGGKAFSMMTGTLHDLEASVDAFEHTVTSDHIVNTEIIASPHEEMPSRFLI